MSSSQSAGDLARTLVVGLEGPWPTPREAAWLKQWRPAGVILFSRNVTGYSQLEHLCRFIHEALPACEIVADHEGGPVSQLASALGRPPVAWALGALNDPNLTRAVHLETGRRLGKVGIDRVLAPCADVLVELRNPVIGARAFGSDQSLVGVHVAAAVAGLVDGGVEACLKHWPGHGASGQDSHLLAADGPATSGAEPFLAGLAAGASGVMVGHILTGAQSVPGTLDSQQMQRWRHRLENAAGCPVTLYADDVTMGGLRAAMAHRGIGAGDGLSEGMADPATLPLAWLEELAAAGLDRLLIRGIPWAALPLTGGLGSSELEDGKFLDEAVPLGWQDAAYQEASRRQQAQLDPAFRSSELVLGWLDLTVGDRWEVAGGEVPGHRELFVAKLGASFAAVQDLRVEREDTKGPLERILVTSHRPLPPAFSGEKNWETHLAPAGLCLVMGHPSLAGELAMVLGSGWSVTSCYEVDWEIFEAGL